MLRLTSRSILNVLFSWLCLVGGCGTAPPPRDYYQDQITSIRLAIDDRAREPHAHPARVSTEAMVRVLSGVRIERRGGILGSIITGRSEQSPAFSPTEVHALAPKLSMALAHARPDELVTFYRRVSDASLGLGITSGGLFVQGSHLYFILANNRTMPSEGMNQNMVYEIDPIDSPLLPIARAGFRVAFSPGMAVVPIDERRSWPYIDEGRIFAVDLVQLEREFRKGITAP